MRGRIGAALLSVVLAILLVPTTATAQYFGRNKVQYQRFDFQVLRTEHFDIYYYPEKREAAVDAARMAERAYARLSRILQHEFEERKPIVLYASHAEFQQTNALGGFIGEGTGGVTESAKQRIIMPFTGAYAEFDHVLTHELVHQFQFDVIFRRGLGGDASPMAARLPLWFMEGMAEYLSLGPVEAHTAGWLRDAVLSGYLRTIGEMNVRNDYLSYRFGHSLWSYIGAKWGDEVVGVLLQRAPRIGLAQAFEATLGVTLAELSREWVTEVRSTYLPLAADFDGADAIGARLTTHEATADPWFIAPALSPDGSRMVYLSQKKGLSFDLWLADARTGQPLRRLVEAARSASFESLRFMNSGAAFSPDGRYLAFAAQTGGRDALYIYDVEEARVLKQLRFELNGLTAPSWSPDGRRIVFSGMVGGLSDLFITDLNGKLERLTRDRHAALMPSWSPDGRSIAFTTDRGPAADMVQLSYGNYRIALYDLESRQVQILPQQEDGRNVNAVWSPDGAHLAWISDRTGTSNIHLFDLAAGELWRISDVLSGVVAVTPLSPALSWSRSGRLLFTYFERAGYNIYAVEDPLQLPRIRVGGALLAGADRVNGNGGSGVADPGRADSAAGAGAVDSAGEPAVSSFYWSDGELRPSARVVDRAAGAAAPVSVTELLGNAALALPDTVHFSHELYRPRLSADFVARPMIGGETGGRHGSGLQGGSFIALSDMLGDHNLVVAGNVNGSLSDATLYTAYSFLRRRANLGGVLFQQPNYRFLGGGRVQVEQDDGQTRDAVGSVLLRDLYRAAQARVSYPVNQFHRIEAGVSGVHFSRDLLHRGVYLDDGRQMNRGTTLETRTYVQPSVAMVYDNTVFGWTGPVLGRRYRLELSHAAGGLHFTEAMLDARNYASLGSGLVLATRLTTLTRLGPDADHFRQFWGGPYQLRGYGSGSFSAEQGECSARDGSISRCPARDQLIGSSAAIGNAEIRMPLLQSLNLGFIGRFPPVTGVLFLDGGMAWEREVCASSDRLSPMECAEDDRRPVRTVFRRDAKDDPVLVRAPLFSYGAGVRINILYSVLRLDYVFPLSRPGFDGRRGIFSLGFGSSF
jgi:hypothetical protein